MDPPHLINALEDYEDNIEHLSEILSPLLTDDGYNTTTKKLPLLDRAKLNITLVYAIESLLFAYLKTSGTTDPKTHPVYQELLRTKSYFDKVKAAEESANTATTKPSITLNKQATQRVLQHSLATHTYSKAEQEAKEAELARLKAELAKKEAEAKRRFLEKRRLKATNGSLAGSESPPSSSSPVIPKAQLPSEISTENTQSADIDMSNNHDGSEDGEIEDEEDSILESRDTQSKPQTLQALTDSTRTRSSDNRRKRRAPR